MFHKGNFGSFGTKLPSDINGFVPEAGDSPEDFNFGHDEFVEDFDSQGDGYDGYAAERWAEFVNEAVEATTDAEAALAAWRDS